MGLPLIIGIIAALGAASKAEQANVPILGDIGGFINDLIPLGASTLGQGVGAAATGTTTGLLGGFGMGMFGDIFGPNTFNFNMNNDPNDPFGLNSLFNIFNTQPQPQLPPSTQPTGAQSVFDNILPGKIQFR